MCAKIATKIEELSSKDKGGKKGLSDEEYTAPSDQLRKCRLATAIWRERRRQERTQKDVAKAAGIKRQALSMVESAQRMNSIAMLYRIAAALKMPLWRLFKDCEGMELESLRPALRERVEKELKK